MKDNPRPLPEKIYMRRRVAAVVIILATVALIVWALTAVAKSGSSDNEEETTANSTLVTTPTEPLPSAKPSTSESPTPTIEPKPSESKTNDDEALAAQTTCEVKDLRVTVEADRPNYGEGEEPQLTGVIHNPTGADCVIDADAAPLRFEVTRMERNGFQRVWGDTDCYPPDVTGRQVFKAGETRRFSTSWSRMDSRPGECSTRQPVAPGAYIAYASVGDNASEGVTFNLN
ncbi:hypothetical protein [Corynebacterium aquatimens]|uniref:Uncharacterized protein n=1 Tax=Corynebacterium aquatimens TaxID=1190508 RepID=A0A931GWA3_9CORY|nr:hypothetical protein [Corynebacterium aquatimens]MBG6122326.1 hypothetical protein [Corynebacterium aquatimens]WJY65132.1 hypothetical protein CAQUA_01995 [Corynebacterium aquatimens]